MVAAALLRHVTLAIPLHALPPATLAFAVAEAAAIWAPHGVVIDAAGSCGPIAADAMLLTVAIATSSTGDGTTVRSGQAARSGVTAGWRGPLGAMTFGPDGAPASTMMIYLTDILGFIRDARVLGAEPSRWPVGLRERIVGRALGRVMAHEIGHYVLQTPQHTRSGLMRPVRSADDLVSPSCDGFGLAPRDVSRLTLNARKEKGPAWAGPLQQTTAKP